MSTHPRMTTTTTQVLQRLLEEPETQRYGLEVIALTGLPSGTVFPILARLEACGWLQSGWEDVDPRAVGRPRRRYYRLTDSGLEAAGAAVSRTTEERRRRALLLRPVEGWA